MRAGIVDGLLDDFEIGSGFFDFDGVEVLDATGDSNTLDYSGYSGGVTVDLDAGTASGSLKVSGFQHLVGSSGDDTLTGDGTANVMVAGQGNDIVTGDHSN